MMRTLLTKAVIAILIFLSFNIASLNAQTDNKGTSDLKAEAAKNFTEGNYSRALEQYRSLLKRYPKDGIFSYYCGLSLLEMNKDLPGAIEYLEFASSKAQVPYQVSYYLGEAYTRNYQFPQAKRAYNQFAAVATKTEAKELIPARLSEMSANASQLTTSYNLVDIMASSLFSFADSAYIRQVKAPGGNLTLKPSELLPTADGINDISNLMFIPRNNEKGDLLFYSGYGKNKKRGLEIFMVKSGNGKKFGEAAAVEALNTDFDEILPYYDPIGKDLYFASKGHNSMGGFDLFKSHYDIERNSWTPPMNLGFPFNSPMDEFLVIPGTDLGSIMLITDRQGLDTLMTAYLLRIHEPRRQMSVADPAELKKIGNFGGIEAIPEMVDMSSDEMLNASVTEEKPASVPVERPKSAQTGMVSAEHGQYLRLALAEQFKSDSLARLAREARISVKELPDADDRWAVQKNIISWEKQSSDFQAKADEYYLMVKQLEKGPADAKKIPDAIAKDTIINDITVYKYRQNQATTETPAVSTTTEIVPAPVVTNPVAGEPGEIVVPVGNAEKAMNRFVLLDKSPYSANNPFPEDANLPKGAYYKVQMAVLGKSPEWNTFGGLSPVTYENVEGKPLKKYFAGKFSEYESAKAALEVVRSKGFPEAFIVGWYDGVKMTVVKVAELEKR